MESNSHSIYLLRHGAIEGEPALYGITDVELSVLGRQQMAKQCQTLNNISLVMSSPLKRCQGFGQEFSERCNAQLNILSEFKECNFGKWDGVPYKNISKKDWLELEQFWQSPDAFAFDGGETLFDMNKRVTSAWQKIIHSIGLNASPTNILLIAHGGVIRLILAHILGLDYRNPRIYKHWKIDYASLTKISLPMHEDALPEINYVALPPNWKGC